MRGTNLGFYARLDEGKRTKGQRKVTFVRATSVHSLRISPAATSGLTMKPSGGKGIAEWKRGGTLALAGPVGYVVHPYHDLSLLLLPCKRSRGTLTIPITARDQRSEELLH